MAATFNDRPDIETLAAVIAHSQIIVAAPARDLPAGYGDVDVAILEWIAAEGRRAGRSFVRM
jgi:glycerol dehydrogenase-like iron-containing ADH family enzyme